MQSVSFANAYMYHSVCHWHFAGWWMSRRVSLWCWNFMTPGQELIPPPAPGSCQSLQRLFLWVWLCWITHLYKLFSACPSKTGLFHISPCPQCYTWDRVSTFQGWVTSTHVVHWSFILNSHRLEEVKMSLGRWKAKDHTQCVHWVIVSPFSLSLVSVYRGAIVCYP